MNSSRAQLEVTFQIVSLVKQADCGIEEPPEKPGAQVVVEHVPAVSTVADPLAQMNPLGSLQVLAVGAISGGKLVTILGKTEAVDARQWITSLP